MPIFVCGINHKTAPLSLREKVVFPIEKLALYLSDLLGHENIREAVIISTCNRSELYCDADDANQLLNWFCLQHQLSYADLQAALYVHEGQAAVEHIMQVACGLDSMVLGEPQILGQIKDAFSESCAAGAVGPLFNRLFQQVFAVAKEVRTNTSIGACPVSVASTTVSLAKQIFPALDTATILVIGAGDTVDLVLRHLQTHSPYRLLIVNRNYEKATALATHYSGTAIPQVFLSDALTDADIVISATGSTLPIITKQMIETILPRRTSRLHILDIAVPRDVEITVADMPEVALFCIDDLKEVIQRNLRGREHAALKAREVITAKACDFSVWILSFDKVATTISAYRKQIEEICRVEMLKASRQLQRGDDPAQVLNAFAHAFTNKLLHTPSVQLRQAGSEGRFDILELAKQLFAIPHTKPGIL
jgi:glutamyl-tRNA reductase